MNEKERKIIDFIKEHPTAHINMIMLATNESKETIQKCLEEYSNIIIPKTRLTIEEQAQWNRTRDRMVKSTVTSRETLEQDILFIYNYYIENQTKPITQIIKELEELKHYPKSYIQRCLIDARIAELIEHNRAKEQPKQLQKKNKRIFNKIRKQND